MRFVSYHQLDIKILNSRREYNLYNKVAKYLILVYVSWWMILTVQCTKHHSNNLNSSCRKYTNKVCVLRNQLINWVNNNKFSTSVVTTTWTAAAAPRTSLSISRSNSAIQTRCKTSLRVSPVANPFFGTQRITKLCTRDKGPEGRPSSWFIAFFFLWGLRCTGDLPRKVLPPKA